MDNGDGGPPPGPVENNDGDINELNISDVFDAITLADPSFGAGACVGETMARQPAASPAAPFMQISEQPASKSLRFRYECEGRSAGSIPGVNSTPENRTYPTLQVYNYVGRAVIVVSCVTKDKPYRPHPHKLVGREHCDRGVCTIKRDITANFEYQFKNLGIQCVKRKEVPDALLQREDLRVDPFKTGYSHRNQPQSIDLNAVRLCFQMFLQNEAGKIWHSLPPVVSEVIFDKKAMSDLQIMRASHCSGTTRGGTQVILLCEKVTREDTAVVFYQEENNQVVWEEAAIVALVHKQVAIAFQTPPYRNPHTKEHVNVMFQLKRLSDNVRSNSLPFEYIPDFQDSDYLRGKRRKTLIPSMLHTAFEQDRSFQVDPTAIKSEPKDKTPPHQMSSPPLQVFPPPYTDPNWGIPMEMQAGPSHLNPFAQDMTWAGPGYGQAISPSLQTLSPNVQALSPVHVQALSPNAQVMSPMGQAMSPMGQAMSPMGQAMSPMGQAMSPLGQARSPMDQPMTPMHGGVSPNHMGHISPNLVQQATYTQMPQQNIMETSQQYNPSLSTLLMERGEGTSITFNSTELSGLSSLLGDRNPDLNDSLRISASELQNYLN